MYSYFKILLLSNLAMLANNTHIPELYHGVRLPAITLYREKPSGSIGHRSNNYHTDEHKTLYDKTLGKIAETQPDTATFNYQDEVKHPSSYTGLNSSYTNPASDPFDFMYFHEMDLELISSSETAKVPLRKQVERYIPKSFRNFTKKLLSNRKKGHTKWHTSTKRRLNKG